MDGDGRKSNLLQQNKMAWTENKKLMMYSGWCGALSVKNAISKQR